MFGRSLKATGSSLMLAGLVLGGSAGSAAASETNVGYQFPIAGGISASSLGLDCVTWRNGDGTMQAKITVMQPYVATPLAMPSSRVRLTTQLDISTDNSHWSRFVLYLPQYVDVTAGNILTGPNRFSFRNFDQPVNLGSASVNYFRAWFKVDFVNSSNQLIAPGDWSVTPVNALISGTEDFVPDSIYSPLFYPSRQIGSCFLMHRLW
jgi:hypothetical protein